VDLVITFDGNFGGNIKWVDCCRYLCMFFVSGRMLKCNFGDAKSLFSKVFNAVYGKVGCLASEEVVLGLCLNGHVLNVKMFAIIIVYKTGMLSVGL